MATHDLALDDLHVDDIVAFLRTKCDEVPEVAIICGSGLNNLGDTLTHQVVIPYSTIPYFPQSTVAGHGQDLVFGNLAGKKIILMRGRFHAYEGYKPAKAALAVRVFAALGCKMMIVTNAAGGVNPEYKVGDIMVMRDHIAINGMAGNHPLVGPNDSRFGPRFPAVTGVYLPKLQQLALASAKELVEFGLPTRIRRGTYVGVSGPTYETEHEIKMMRIIGGDAVGMSTVFETIVAAHCSLPVLGMSLITNECVGPDEDKPKPTHEEVLAETKKATAGMQALVTRILTQVDTASMPAPPVAQLFVKGATTAPAAVRVAGAGGAGGVLGGTGMVSPALLATLVGLSLAAGLLGGYLGARAFHAASKR